MIDRAVRVLGLSGIVSLAAACASSGAVESQTGNANPSIDEPSSTSDDDKPGNSDHDGDDTPGQGGDGDGDTNAPDDGANTGDGDGDGDGDGTPIDGPADDARITFPMAVDFYYAVSGYSGDGETPGLVGETQSCPVRAGQGRGNCHAFTYTPGSVGWAGVFWQYPANNWGTDLGRPVPAHAKSVSFYAWSDTGGEALTFGAGLKDFDAFNLTRPDVTLTSTPTRYTLSLDGVSYGDDVISAFFWSAAGTGKERVAFYVDDIVWEGDNAPVGGDGDGDGDPGAGGGGGGNTPAPDFPAGPGASGVSLRVMNNCSFPLYIGGDGQGFSLSPSRVLLQKGEIHNYDVPKVWAAARVNAFSGPNDAEPRDKAELTFYHNNGDGKDHVSYNVTYVDWLGLPIEVTSLGGACNAAEHTTGCSVPASEVLKGCPQGFLQANDRCLSPRTYCLTGHQNEPYCKKLDQAIASCATCPKGSTTEAYACSGPFANEPRMCAALNRGMVSAPDNPDENAYYENPPFNDYAKWVHEVCPGIYAFSYDDWLSHGGYRDCAGGTEVRITFCPGG
jgi:hypothetical protein